MYLKVKHQSGINVRQYIVLYIVCCGRLEMSNEILHLAEDLLLTNFRKLSVDF